MSKREKQVAPPGLVDVTLLAWTYPRWRRPFTWLLWHTPVVRVVARVLFRVNPYQRVVRVYDASMIVGRIR